MRSGKKVSQRIVRHLGVAKTGTQLEKLKELGEVVKAEIQCELRSSLIPPKDLADLAIRAGQSGGTRGRRSISGRPARGIGPGIVEAANKVLVVHRTKRIGMRWRICSGQAVLSFRALRKSGLFDRTRSDLMAARDAANENHPLSNCAITE